MRDFSVKEVKTRVIEDNDALAAELRSDLEAKGVFLVNLMASPGAGKTTTLVRVIRALSGKYRIGVMEADVDSVVDAKTIAETDAKVIQLHTGGSCHMDADMTRRGLEGLGTDDLDVVFLENVGNMVCPAEFDVGSAKKIMILSVPEGDDKPLKYPLMFSVTECLLVNKTDTAPAFNFSMERLKNNIEPLNPGLPVFPLSARTGEGFEPFVSWLDKEIEEWRAKHPAGKEA